MNLSLGKVEINGTLFRKGMDIAEIRKNPCFKSYSLDIDPSASFYSKQAFIDGYSFEVCTIFSHGIISGVCLIPTNLQINAEKYSKEYIAEKKRISDSFLKKHLGEPQKEDLAGIHYNYDWGSIKSSMINLRDLDERGNIKIFYKEKLKQSINNLEEGEIEINDVILHKDISIEKLLNNPRFTSHFEQKGTMCIFRSKQVNIDGLIFDAEIIFVNEKINSIKLTPANININEPKYTTEECLEERKKICNFLLENYLGISDIKVNTVLLYEYDWGSISTKTYLNKDNRDNDDFIFIDYSAWESKSNLIDLAKGEIKLNNVVFNQNTKVEEIIYDSKFKIYQYSNNAKDILVIAQLYVDNYIFCINIFFSNGNLTSIDLLPINPNKKDTWDTYKHKKEKIEISNFILTKYLGKPQLVGEDCVFYRCDWGTIIMSKEMYKPLIYRDGHIVMIYGFHPTKLNK